MTAGPVFVDTETLGLDPRIHRVWEVAAIVDDVEHVWHLDLTIEQVENADEVAIQISGFDVRWPPMQERCSVPVFLDQFIELTRGRHLAGAVVSFDEERLRRLAWEHGRTPAWHYHLIDVEAMAIGYLAALHRPPARPLIDGGAVLELPWDSDDLTSGLGLAPVPEHERHTALGDARWAKRIYERVLGLD